MKDQNKLIIGVVAIIAVVYFLFFKQKEGFNNVKEGIDKQELLWYMTVMLPLKHGGRLDHPEVQKSRAFLDFIMKSKDPGILTDISPEDIQIFKNTGEKLEAKYSQILPKFLNYLQERQREQLTTQPPQLTTQPPQLTTQPPQQPPPYKIIPEEIMIYTYFIAPLKLGLKHPDVIKARELTERMGFSDKLQEFGNKMDFIDKKYSAMFADVNIMPPGPGENPPQLTTQPPTTTTFTPLATIPPPTTTTFTPLATIPPQLTTPLPLTPLAPADTCQEECPEKLVSISREFIAVFDKNTGNLSVQHVKGGKILWQSNSRNRGNGPYRLKMQIDGNLVIYDRNGKPTWASNTGGKGKGPFRIVMQDDYNLVIYGSTGPTWASRSA
jgi:hypothetical protein